MRSRFVRDDGQVLMLALVFLGFVALVLAATLTAAASSLHATQLSTQQRDERYAAEAGVLAAAARMQSDPSQNLGRDPGANPQSAPDCGFHPSSDGSGFVVNSMQVDVTCTPHTGSGAGTDGANRPPYSVLALTEQGSASNEGVIAVNVPNVQVFGPVGSAGACNIPACPTPPTNPPPSDPGQGGLDSRYAPDSPSKPATTDPVPSCDASTATFSPGTYTKPPSITGCNKPWWFKPGDYYFDFNNSGSHVWIINTTVVGGLTTGWDGRRQAPSLPGSCRTDQNLAATDGVQFVFGGDSTMQVGPTGAVELCAKPSTFRQEIAIYGMTPAVSGIAGPTSQTLNPDPTTAANNVAPYVPYDVPGNAAVVDGQNAQALIPAAGTSWINVGGFPALPAGSIITDATVNVVHHEDPAMQSFSVGVNDGPTPILSQTFPVNTTCNAGPNPSCFTPFGIPTQVLTDPTLISRLNVTFTATAPSGGGASYNSFVDGIQLVLHVYLPGGYRPLVGCTQQTTGTQANPSQPCPLVSTVPGAQLYVQGTVYAPTGGLDVNGQTTDPVRFNRGIIARTVVFRAGNGGFGPGVTAGGAFNRWVVLEARAGPNLNLRVATTVMFDDAQAFVQKRLPAITYNNWDVK
jgi:hypothetical protein